MKPHEVSTLEDLRAYEESLGVWRNAVGWADDIQVRREDGAVHLSQGADGSIEMTLWAMPGSPRTSKTFPDMRAAMQDIVSGRLLGQLQKAVRARGVAWESWRFGIARDPDTPVPGEGAWTIVIADGWLHVGGMTMGRFRGYSTHESVEGAADELARLVSTRGPVEAVSEGEDLAAVGAVTARGVFQRVDAEGGGPRPAGVGPGDVLDRVGHESGSQLFALGTPFAQRSQPPDAVGAEYHRYRVLSGLPDAQEGRAVAWFGQPGGGAMVVAEHPVRWYVDNGYLVELVDPEGA